MFCSLPVVSCYWTSWPSRSWVNCFGQWWKPARVVFYCSLWVHSWNSLWIFTDRRFYGAGQRGNCVWWLPPYWLYLRVLGSTMGWGPSLLAWNPKLSGIPFSQGLLTLRHSGLPLHIPHTATSVVIFMSHGCSGQPFLDSLMLVPKIFLWAHVSYCADLSNICLFD